MIDNVVKKCCKCTQTLPIEEFYKRKDRPGGRVSKCKKCARQRGHLYYLQNSPSILDRRHTNKEKIALYDTQRYEKNRPEMLITMAVYRGKHRKEHAIYDALYNKEHREEINVRERKRVKTDINYKLARSLRSRMRAAVRNGDKAGSAVDDLGCSIDVFRAYLETHFSPGMTWDNWGNGPGKWHLDHIIPLAAFDLTNYEQFLSAANYRNYQPLWSHENLSKGAKLD